MESETEFLLRRASEESLKAMNSIQPQAEVAHEELALRYSVKAIDALSMLTKVNPPLEDLKRNPASQRRV